MKKLCALFLGLIISSSAFSLESGYGTYQFPMPKEFGENKEMKVWYYKPSKYDENTPVLFVFHGRKRNADDYSAEWLEIAEKNNIMLLVPQYSNKLFPGANGYNLGNVYDAQTESEVKGLTIPEKINPKNKWSFILADKIFEHFKTDLEKNNNQKYFAYGHGGGSQHLARLLMFYPEANIQRAYVANPGWYTLPSRDEVWPYGIRGIKAIDDETLKKFFQFPVTFIVSDLDNDINHYLQRLNPEALRTGAWGRHERGFYFVNHGKEVAETLGVKNTWKIEEVKGSEHDNFIVANDAAKLINKEMEK